MYLNFNKAFTKCLLIFLMAGSFTEKGMAGPEELKTLKARFKFLEDNFPREALFKPKDLPCDLNMKAYSEDVATTFKFLVLREKIYRSPVNFVKIKRAKLQIESPEMWTYPKDPGAFLFKQALEKSQHISPKGKTAGKKSRSKISSTTSSLVSRRKWYQTYLPAIPESEDLLDRMAYEELFGLSQLPKPPKEMEGQEQAQEQQLLQEAMNFVNISPVNSSLSDLGEENAKILWNEGGCWAFPNLKASQPLGEPEKLLDVRKNPQDQNVQQLLSGHLQNPQQDTPFNGASRTSLHKPALTLASLPFQEDTKGVTFLSQSSEEEDELLREATTVHLNVNFFPDLPSQCQIEGEELENLLENTKEVEVWQKPPSYQGFESDF